MATKRFQNRCKDCGDTWYPRGRDLSRSCPACGSRNVGYAGCCGCTGLGGLGVAFLVFCIFSIVVSLFTESGDDKAIEAPSDTKVASNTGTNKIAETNEEPAPEREAEVSGVSSEPVAAMLTPIRGMTAYTLYDKLDLAQKGFIVKSSESPNASPWVFERTADGGEYSLTVEGESMNEIFRIEAEVLDFDEEGVDVRAMNYFKVIATLGSDSASAGDAVDWVSSSIGSSSEIQIGSLMFRLTADGPNERSLQITTAD